MGFKIFVLKRFLYTIVLVFAVISLNFIIFMMMPGDPAERLVNPNMIGKSEIIDTLRAQWGFDQPLHVRYGKYIVNMLTGQFGFSYRSNKPISDEIFERLSNTIILVVPPEIAAVAAGVLVGALAARKRGKWLDNLSVTTSLTVYALPVFWIAMMLILIFSINLGWLPAAHSQPDSWLLYPPANIFEIVGTKLTYLILPWITLFLISFGSYVLLNSSKCFGSHNRRLRRNRQSKRSPRKDYTVQAYLKKRTVTHNNRSSNNIRFYTFRGNNH